MPDRFLLVVQIGVRQQSQVTSTLDGACQLTLILGAGTGDTARYDLARFSDVVFQSNDIFVVDLGNVLGGEAAELTTTEITCNGLYPLMR